MSKLTGTVAFIGGVLLIVMAITGILIKNERQMKSHGTTVTEVVVKIESEHEPSHAIPQWLNLAMYGTLILSGVFTIIQVSRYGLSTEPSTMSSAAFVGGLLLVGLGFMATLAVNEQNFKDHRQSKKLVVAAKEMVQEPESDHHDNAIPEEMKYLMMVTLFVSGGVAAFHVSKYGLA